MQADVDPGNQEMPVAIYDPGEVDRENQIRGDRLIVKISNVVAWLFPILMVIICMQVVFRTLGRADIGPGNQAWMDDLQWWLYGIAVLVGVAYAATTDSHVRVDIFYDNFDEKKKARTDLFALAWLFLPFLIFCWDVTQNYAITSYVSDEGSSSPNGLHNLWILKIAVNISFIFAGIATWAAYIRQLRKLRKPTLGAQLLYAFPSTMYLVNLAFYYLSFGIIWALSPAETTTREVGRHALFDELELGPWDIKVSILVTLALTLALIGAAILRDARRAK